MKPLERFSKSLVVCQVKLFYSLTGHDAVAYFMGHATTKQVKTTYTRHRPKNQLETIRKLPIPMYLFKRSFLKQELFILVQPPDTMNYSFEIIQGIHPGLIVERELKKQGLTLEQFAISIDVDVAIIADIINGTADIDFALASTIEKALEMDNGFLLKLQSFYDFKQKEEEQANQYKPDLSKFRPALFWDTRIENINWHRQQKSIIHRIFERGNFSEKKELIRFYGRDVIKTHLKRLRSS